MKLSIGQWGPNGLCSLARVRAGVHFISRWVMGATLFYVFCALVAGIALGRLTTLITTCNLARSLAPHCLLCMRAPLPSLVRSIAQSLTPEHGENGDCEMSHFKLFWTIVHHFRLQCAPLCSCSKRLHWRSESFTVCAFCFGCSFLYLPFISPLLQLILTPTAFSLFLHFSARKKKKKKKKKKKRKEEENS